MNPKSHGEDTGKNPIGATLRHDRDAPMNDQENAGGYRRHGAGQDGGDGAEQLALFQRDLAVGGDAGGDGGDDLRLTLGLESGQLGQRRVERLLACTPGFGNNRNLLGSFCAPA